jgi:biopolymer transport protein TolR
MARRRRPGGFTINAEISVTSLVDVAFTLLVIFIITAPILQGGVDVQVPRAQAESLASPEGIIVSVNREGSIFIGQAEASWEEFEPALIDAVRRRQVSNVYLRADHGVEYGRVAQVLGAMKALDLATVSLVMEPDVPRRGGGGGR